MGVPVALAVPGPVVQVRQVQHVPGLVGQHQPVRRMPLEDGDHPPQVGAVGAQRPGQVDDLGGVRVDARRVRVGDQVHDVVPREVDDRIGHGERVLEVRGAPGGAPVALHRVLRGRTRHSQPSPHRVRPDAEPSVRGPPEVVVGEGEMVGHQLPRSGERLRVWEGKKHHHRVEGTGRTGVMGVPGVEPLGVVGGGALQRARFQAGPGGGGVGDDGRRGECGQGGDHGRRGAHARTAAEPLAEGDGTRHGYLRARFPGHRTQTV